MIAFIFFQPLFRGQKEIKVGFFAWIEDPTISFWHFLTFKTDKRALFGIYSFILISVVVFETEHDFLLVHHNVLVTIMCRNDELSLFTI